MSKELPYFKFFPTEYLLGNITLQDYRAQGVFINICALYWQKECSLPKATLEARFKDVIDDINFLLNAKILQENHGNIKIKFLDIQWKELYERHLRLSESGRKGGKARLSLAKATLKHKDKEEDKDKNKIRKELVFPFVSDEFMSVWNILKNEKNWKSKSHNALQASLKTLSKYPEHEAIQMMENTIAGGWRGVFPLNEKQKQDGTTKQERIGKAYSDFLNK